MSWQTTITGTKQSDGLPYQLPSGTFFGNVTEERQHPLFLACLSTHDAQAEARMHAHANSYFSLLVKGSYIEKNGQRDQLIRPGQLLYRSADYVHGNIFLSDTVCFNLEITSASIDTLPFLKTEFSLLSSGSSLFYQLMARQLNNPLADNAAEVLIHFFDSLQPSTNDFKAPWLNQVKKIMEEEIATYHTIESLATRVFVHPVYLARAFKQKQGTTIGQYQMKVKMETATRLLLSKNLPIHRIAADTGFYDTPHFIRCFKAFYHLRPREFRQLTKG